MCDTLSIPRPSLGASEYLLTCSFASDRILSDFAAQVVIRRILKGSKDLVGSIMIVEGLHVECDRLHVNDLR